MLKSSRWILSTLAVLAALACLSSRTFAYTANQLLPVGGKPAYINGVNLAWLDGAYGFDIGYNPVHPDYGCHYNSTHLDHYFADMESLHLNVVRIWLFEGMQGLQLDSSQHVSGLDPTFVTNFQDILRLAANHHIYCYFTLHNNLSATPYFNIVTDPTARAAYLDNAVTPLITLTKDNPQIFAFDVMNECEGDITGSTGNYTNVGTDWATMRSFITDNAARIHSIDPHRLVTSTSGWHNYSSVQAGEFSGLGLDFYDVHVYGDTGYVPNVSALHIDKPVIIGEYGQTTNAWNDALQLGVTAAITTNGRDRGYAGALEWDYNYPGATEIYTLVNPNGSHRPALNLLGAFNANAPSPMTLFSWENGTVEGWSGSNLSGGPATIYDWSADGNNSLKGSVTLQNNTTYTLAYAADSNFSGKSLLRADVRYAPSGNIGTGMAANLYVVTGPSATRYTGPSIPISSSGTIVTIDLTQVPNLDQVHEIGVQYTTGTGASGASAVYVDYVAILDPSVPVTTSALSGTTGLGGWYTGPVQVTLSPTDADGPADIAHTYYTMDGGVQQAGTSFTVSGDANHTITFWSVDQNGNTESVNSQSIKIDGTAPVTTASVVASQVTLTAIDPQSGVAHTFYTLDGSSQHTYTTPFTFSGAGNHVVTYWSVDVAGNVETAKTLNTDHADHSAPTTTATLSGSAGSNGWYKGPVHITLTATDPDGAADVAQTYYSVDDGALQSGTSITVSDDGLHHLSFYSVDTAGNGEVTQTLSVKIDATQPTFTFETPHPAPNAAGWNHTAVTIPYAAHDATSGVASASPSSPLQVTSEGMNLVLLVTATDNAGNIRTQSSPPVKINFSAPVTLLVANGPQITLTASDNLSGVVHTFYTVDGGSAQAYTAPVTLAATGSHTITYWSVDAADNVETAHTATVTTDSSGPPPSPPGLPAVATFTAGLHLMSLPQDYPGVSLDLLFGYSGVKLAVWQPGSLQYAVTPTAPANEIRLGHGYWARFPQAVTVTQTGTLANTAQDYPIGLQPGWNMIGDPFSSNVALGSVHVSGNGKTYSFADAAGSGQLISGTIYGYNTAIHSYTPATSLEAGQGYWVHASVASVMILPHP